MKDNIKSNKLKKFFSNWETNKTNNKEERSSSSEDSKEVKKKSFHIGNFNINNFTDSNKNIITSTKTENNSNSTSLLSFLPNPNNLLKDKNSPIESLKNKIELELNEDNYKVYNNLSFLNKEFNENDNNIEENEENELESSSDNLSNYQDENNSKKHLIKLNNKNNSSILKSINYQINRMESEHDLLRKKNKLSAKQKYGW